MTGPASETTGHALEADLMPYEVLDAIERAAIRDKRSPSEVLTLILDPKTWCRFPILSGGFTRELRELRETLAREKT